MRRLVIFGRSPFVNRINVQRIIDNNVTCGLNNFAESYEVHYNFCWKEFLMPMSLQTNVFYHFEEDENRLGEKYKPIASREPLLEMKIQDGIIHLAKANFIASVALNWGILLEYDEICLVGIDHVESDKSFMHFDGKYDEYGNTMTPEMHKEFKQYVYECAKHVRIYQTNPAVKDDWNLPYKDIGELYVK